MLKEKEDLDEVFCKKFVAFETEDYEFFFLIFLNVIVKIVKQ